MKKLLPVAILALVVLLCSASAVSAQLTGLHVSIIPEVQYASPQISQFWTIPSSPPASPLQSDKTVTYTVTVTTDCPGQVWVSITPGGAPTSWFDWLNEDSTSATTIWPLNITVPQTLGKNAGGEYTITVTAVDSCGKIVQDTATLIVQDYGYVTETLVQDAAGTYTLNEDYRNMAVAAKVKKDIDFVGEVETLTKNEYLLVNAKGNNANYEQESTIVNYRATLPGDHLIGDEQFKSCAVMGGTGARFHEHYEVYYDSESNDSNIESDQTNTIALRCENLNHHVTGDQRWKTEFTTLNEFDGGRYLLESGQSVPCTKSISSRDEIAGKFTFGRHIIYTRP